MTTSYDKALLEKTFASIVSKSLGEHAVKVIKQRLFEKYGLSLYQAVNEEFGKLFDILKENFTEGGANNIEKQFRAATINLHRKVPKKKAETLIISKPETVNRIMSYLGDNDMMEILNKTMNKPKLISEILDSCKLPQTSGYRKINKLVDAGLLIISGFNIGTDGRQIFKYTSSFDTITVFIESKKSKIRITPKKIGKNSYLPIPFI